MPAWTQVRGAGGVDEITFGYYTPDGGTSGEMLIRWKALEAGKPPTARLESFQDSWHALATFKDVLDALGELDNTYPTVAHVAQALLACGFTDATPRVAPQPKKT